MVIHLSQSIQRIRNALCHRVAQLFSNRRPVLSIRNHEFSRHLSITTTMSPYLSNLTYSCLYITSQSSFFLSPHQHLTILAIPSFLFLLVPHCLLSPLTSSPSQAHSCSLTYRAPCPHLSFCLLPPHWLTFVPSAFKSSCFIFHTACRRSTESTEEKSLFQPSNLLGTEGMIRELKAECQ